MRILSPVILSLASPSAWESARTPPSGFPIRSKSGSWHCWHPAARSGVKATFWEGSFAAFAAIIAASRLYVGYDSAGQHVAAACGVPLVSIFAGFPAPRMFHRWRPTGDRATVIRVDRPDPFETLERLRAAIDG
jgi:hypothetical protein